MAKTISFEVTDEEEKAVSENPRYSGITFYPL